MDYFPIIKHPTPFLASLLNISPENFLSLKRKHNFFYYQQSIETKIQNLLEISYNKIEKLKYSKRD